MFRKEAPCFAAQIPLSHNEKTHLKTCNKDNWLPTRAIPHPGPCQAGVGLAVGGYADRQLAAGAPVGQLRKTLQAAPGILRDGAGLDVGGEVGRLGVLEFWSLGSASMVSCFGCL